MPRRVQAMVGTANVALPSGWILDAGDQVVVSDDEWATIQDRPDLLAFLDDLGATAVTPDRVPTWRDIQRIVLAGPSGSGSADAVGTALAAHIDDTTQVHGITDTSKLAWNQQVAAAVLTAADGTVLTRVAGAWTAAEPATPPAQSAGYEAVFNFASPRDAWPITHNQGTRALHVETFDNNDDPIEGTVLYPDLNTITIDWFYPQTGYARVWGGA